MISIGLVTAAAMAADAPAQPRRRGATCDGGEASIVKRGTRLSAPRVAREGLNSQTESHTTRPIPWSLSLSRSHASRRLHSLSSVDICVDSPHLSNVTKTAPGICIDAPPWQGVGPAPVSIAVWNTNRGLDEAKLSSYV